ncbi:hypothetical protein AB0D62_37255 [Streptomyces massasporeus]|uniref:hypothetical protein n=1 Tax=Streptomyces massasporeus TaxID=67324 RepID=UPI0033F72F92
MSVGFRPTAADNDIIQAHKRPDESTSDVLRRALRALDREKWQAQAREDMQRIAASEEDLSAEPDEWGFDEAGEPVDLRSEGVQPSRDVPRGDREAAFEEQVRGLLTAMNEPGDRHDLRHVAWTSLRDASTAALSLADSWTPTEDLKSKLALHNVGEKIDLLAHLATCAVADEATGATQPDDAVLPASVTWVKRNSTLANSGTGVFSVVDFKTYTGREPGSSSPAARRPGDSWRVAHLRALAARRDSER